MAQLICECIDDDFKTWHDGSTLTVYTKSRAKKCQSKDCSNIIRSNDTTTVFNNYRSPTEWELDHLNYQDDKWVKIADSHYCESCGDLIQSMEESGYCVFSKDDFTKILPR